MESLKKLKYLYFAGAGLRKSLGDSLNQHLKLVAGIGTTEAGAYFQKLRNDGKWEYLTFSPVMGVTFERFSQDFDLYEMIFQRNPELERWQQVFSVYPHLQTYRTKDLYERHPTEINLWRHVGRTDDFVKLSSGLGLYAAKLEEIILQDSRINGALIGGQGQARPFVILDVDFASNKEDKDSKTVINGLWPVIEKANQHCSEFARLTRSLTMLKDPARPLPLTAKGTISRKDAFELYESDIEAMYQKASSQTSN